MASINFYIKVDGVKAASEAVNIDTKKYLHKANLKFKVASRRMEVYAKSAAPVKTGFHKRHINHDPKAPFLTGRVTASAYYASILEYGFFGVVHVPPYTRKKTGVKVGGYPLPMRRPARPHIIPAFKQALTQLIADLESIKKLSTK